MAQKSVGVDRTSRSHQPKCTRPAPPPDPISRDATFILFEIGTSQAETEPVGVPPVWVTWVAAALEQLLFDDPLVRNHVRPQHGKCFVVAVDASKLAREPVIRDADQIAPQLRVLLLEALSGRAAGGARGLLLDPGDGGGGIDGQLLGTVLLLGSLSEAKALCKTIRDGEGNLPPEPEKENRYLQSEAAAALQGMLDRIAAALPVQYAARREALAELSDVFRASFAAALEPALNAQASAMPQASYEDKKDLAKWVNAQLRALGLAVKDPKTGRPCHLVGSPGNRPDVGRFMLNHRDAGGRLVHGLTSVTLPHLELIPDDLSRGPPGLGTGSSRSR